MDFSIPRLVGAMPDMGDDELDHIATNANAIIFERADKVAVEGATKDGKKVHRCLKPSKHGQSRTMCGNGKWATPVVSSVTCKTCTRSPFASKVRRISADCYRCDGDLIVWSWTALGNYEQTPCPECS